MKAARLSPRRNGSPPSPPRPLVPKINHSNSGSEDGEESDSEVGAKQQLRVRQYDSPAYLSSASSNDGVTFDRKTPPLMRHRKSSSDEIAVSSSTHQFVQFPAFYDSDASDGSLVFSYPRGTTPPATYDAAHAGVRGASSHERWGSMDSSGSFQPRDMPGSKNQNQPNPQRGAPSPQIMYNSYNPQLLPYHQRRKLLQKRQQQRQQQQKGSAQQSMQETPSSVDYHGVLNAPMHSPSLSQQLGSPSTQAMVRGRGSESTVSPRGRHSHNKPQLMGNTTPPYQNKRPFPLDTISAPHKTPFGQSPTFNHPPPAPPPIPQYPSLPPSGHSRSYSGSGSFVQPNRSRLSSLDSNASTESGGASSRRPRRPSDQRNQKNTYAPPPPPPGPPPPYSHIRSESSGSISSLGSVSDQQLTPSNNHGMSLTDRLDQDIAGYLREQEQHRSYKLPVPLPQHHQQQRQQQHHQQQQQQQQQQHQSHLQIDGRGPARSRHDHRHRGSGGSGFLLGLFNVSPRSQHKQSPNVEEYHQRNQAFLQRAERERAKIQMRFHPQPPPRRAPGSGGSPRPPNVRGRHRQGLASIDNDNWEEEEKKVKSAGRISSRESSYRAESNSTSFVSSSQDDEEDDSDDGASNPRADRMGILELDSDDANERTSLLPPSGISTQEGEGSGKSQQRTRYVVADSVSSRSSGSRPSSNTSNSDFMANEALWQRQETLRWDNRRTTAAKKNKGHRHKHRQKKGKKERRRSRRHRKISSGDSEEDSDEFSNVSSSSSDYDYRRWVKKRAKMFEKERTKLIAQWKEEARAEAEANRWHRRFGRWLEMEFSSVSDSALKFLATAETFICNLPLTIGAIALAIVTLGVVWFKFAEENLDSCEPVHFHSSQCTFPEFPGCFYCDTTSQMYKLAVNFHFACSAVAGVLAMGFMAKVVLASRVVLDEMSSPTTSSPAGLICMTTVCVFAGRGVIGQVLVSLAASLHLGLVIWFIYMALAYHIMPEPSWFPNTVGIGLSAVKTWLYYPMPGHFLMAISLSLNFFFFPISLIRVGLNKKMSAPVCWIQMSAPAISLYALTIMAQPSFEEELPDVTKFQRVHRMIYLPCMHFLFLLAVVGLISSVQSLATRWSKFRQREFSPAHAAFCFPTLAHANAIQAYRAAVDAFSDITPGSPFKIALYTYWVLVLASGTIATLFVTVKFFYHLPSWTQVDVADEEEPPAPNETTLRDVIATGETLRQPFVSPAVLQANETGALVFLRRGGDAGRGRYVRTRRLPALGFEPTMNWSEMNAERDVLLDWVAKNPPRRRKKTLSVPGIDFNYGFGDFGTGNTGVYGGLESGSHNRGFSVGAHRQRSNTFDASFQQGGNYY